MSVRYPFDMVGPDRPASLDTPEGVKEALESRPFLHYASSLDEGGRIFYADPALNVAINTAIAVGAPLLVTGEPGAGKTTAAYYTRHRLGLDRVIHFQAKSTSRARDLLYYYDSVRYFHDAGIAARATEPGTGAATALPDRARYVEPGPLWRAMTGPRPAVLLIDEIDKAPRDFPNDLLHELDQLEFVVQETGARVGLENQALRPIVFITSNSERSLPEPFLRRCVYHHLRLTEDILRQAVKGRRQEFATLSDDFVELALDRFFRLRARCERKRPSTGEYLVWLRTLALQSGVSEADLDQDPARLPHLSVLVKDREDLKALLDGAEA